MDCLHCRSYGPLRVFFQASCSRRSESLFGQPFSVALLIQALRGPLPAVLFCCWARQAHRGAHLAGLLLCRSAYQALKGAPWVRSYSGVQCIRRLMGQPLYCSAADAGMWERGATVMAPLLLHDLTVLPCFHGCLAFLHRYFPPQSPPSHPLNLSLLSQ